MSDPNAPLRISPTQIDVVERCQRLWFFDRILNLRDRTPSKGQGIGLRVEDMIAAALFNGVTPPAGKEGNIAKAMLKLLPAPGTPGMVSQQEFEFPVDVDGTIVIVNGKKDLVIPGVIVYDFKTTKSLSKYQKTPAQLQADIQSEIYAYDEWLKNKLNPVPLDWVYGQTEGAQRSDHTAITMTLETMQRGVARAVDAGRKILQMRADKPPVETIPANTRACDMFGGCAHRAYCPARASKLSDFLPKENGMGFKDRLKESLGIADDGSKASLPEPPPSAPEVRHGSNGKEVLVEDPAARCIACEGTGWNSKGGFCKVCEGSGEKTVKVPAVSAQGVNPPDALPSPDDQPKAPATEATAATVEEKPKRTRRTKEQIAADNAAVAAKEASSEVNQQMVAVKAAHAAEDAGLEEKAIEAAAFSDALTAPAAKTILLVDALSLKGYATPLEPMLRAAARAAAEKGGVEDWRFVEYGKGAGLLLVSFAELWAKAPPFGMITVNSREPEANAVLAWLIEQVDSVVKGVA